MTEIVTTINLVEIDIIEPMVGDGVEGFKICFVDTGELGFISADTLHNARMQETSATNTG